jgi:hypothetical protein
VALGRGKNNSVAVACTSMATIATSAAHYLEPEARLDAHGGGLTQVRGGHNAKPHTHKSKRGCGIRPFEKVEQVVLRFFVEFQLFLSKAWSFLTVLFLVALGTPRGVANTTLPFSSYWAQH